MKRFIEVEVAYWMYDLGGECKQVGYNWRTPDGAWNHHPVKSDVELLPEDVERMRRLIEDKVNGDPFP